MDKTVPKYAAVILNFIGDIEAPAGYDTIFANYQKKSGIRVTKLSLAEVQELQCTQYKKAVKSSATGRYQFMYATLRGLIAELKLNAKTQKLDSDLQDRLAYHLLKRRGIDQWIAGKLTNTQFALRLAQEWASLPVLSCTPRKGKRAAERGESYYVGDDLNKSLIRPEQVEAMLEKAWAEYKSEVQHPPRSKTPEKVGGAVIGGATTAVVVQETVSATGVSFEQIIDAMTQIAPFGLPILGVAVVVGILYFVYKKWKG